MTPTLSDQLQAVLLRHVTQSENGIAVLDANDRFLFHNATFAQMFGFESQSMIGLSHDDMMTWMFTHKNGANIEKETLQDWLDYVHDRHRSAPFRSFEVDLVDGRWLLLNEQKYESGEMVTVSVDITRIKQTELALRQAHADLERLAMTDELTGVPNRRQFLKQLASEQERAKRYVHPTCLAMLDLDHFKLVNDRYGHPVGDEVLKHFAALLRTHLRTEDMIGRLGGEEFAVLLPETTLEGALTVLERVRQALQRETLEHIAPGFSYTFSTGIAALALDAPISCNNWMKNADQALYQAKATGRNKVVLFQPG